MADTSKYQKTGGYQECLDLARELEQASPFVHVLNTGKIPQTRDMMAIVLSKMILISIPVFNVDRHERFGPFNRINEQGPEEVRFRPPRNA